MPAHFIACFTRFTNFCLVGGFPDANRKSGPLFTICFAKSVKTAATGHSITCCKYALSDQFSPSTITSWGIKCHDGSDTVIVGTVSSPDRRNVKMLGSKLPTACYCHGNMDLC